MPTVKESRNDSAITDEAPKVEYEKLISIDGNFQNYNYKGKGDKTNGDVHYCSIISSLPLVEKKEDPKVFTIPWSIGPFNVRQALCDMRAGINLIPLVL